MIGAGVGLSSVGRWMTTGDSLNRSSPWLLPFLELVPYSRSQSPLALPTSLGGGAADCELDRLTISLILKLLLLLRNSLFLSLRLILSNLIISITFEVRCPAAASKSETGDRPDAMA